LKNVDQKLGSFSALVGPNASGKTTFLDVISFLGDLVRNRSDVAETVMARSSNFSKLLWLEQGKTFQLAIEAEIPPHLHQAMHEKNQRFTHIRYEVEVGFGSDENTIGIEHETLWLLAPIQDAIDYQRDLFPSDNKTDISILSKQSKDRKVIVKKTPSGNDNYYAEGKQKTYNPSYKLGPTKSALSNLPADEKSFPISTWFCDMLCDGVQPFILNSKIIRNPSPPGLGRRFQTDGSNLPWVIEELKKNHDLFQSWLNHVRTALEDIKSIETVERPEDRHRYLVVEYANGAKVPSWLVSDGTLRLLALTIPAYLPDLTGTFLIEEPENGIHPRAIETVLQSLSSMYESQVLIATHSPIAINMLDPSQILCFAKSSSGATDIISGNSHPLLQHWKKGKPELGILFASGILS
jgi:predicted ATPase